MLLNSGGGDPFVFGGVSFAVVAKVVWMADISVYTTSLAAVVVASAERMSLHKMNVEAMSGIIQYDYEKGHPPFDIC